MSPGAPTGTESEVGFCACCRGICSPLNKKHNHVIPQKPSTKDKATQYDPHLVASDNKKQGKRKVVHKTESHKVIHKDDHKDTHKVIHKDDHKDTHKDAHKDTHKSIIKNVLKTQDHHETPKKDKMKTPKKIKLKNYLKHQNEGDEDNQKNLVLVITKLGKKGVMCSALKLDSNSKSNKSV